MTSYTPAQSGGTFLHGRSPRSGHDKCMPVSESQLTISLAETPLSVNYLRPDQPVAMLVLAHGAGAGKEHPFMAGFAAAMADRGVATLRFNFPYRDAGRKFPDRPPVAIAAWRAAMDVAEGLEPGLARWAAGKSFGGRMASMAVADGMEAAGLVYLGYPLHPPGKPEKVRDEHLYGLTLPMLFLQGSRDTFATPEILEDVVRRIGPTAELQWVTGGDHSFAVAGTKRSPGDVGASVAGPAADFILARN